MKRRRQDGYVLLMALLITTFVAAVAALGAAALGARQAIVASDAGAARALAQLQGVMYTARDTLRWRPSLSHGSDSGDTDPTGFWRASWATQTPAPGIPPQATLTLEASTGGARKGVQAVVELRPESSPQGVAISGDVNLTASLSLSCTGLYCGGTLRGREWLSFERQSAAGEAQDCVRGQLWPAAAAHAGGEIWTAGQEIHGAEGTVVTTWTADTDAHTGEDQVAVVSAPPSASLLSGVREHATDPGVALHDNALSLSQLPQRPRAGGEDRQEIIVALECPAGQPLTIAGELPEAIDNLILLVDGDALLGTPDSEPTVTRGALLVTGELRVLGPARHKGHVSAGTLTVAAPWHVDIAATWRDTPLSGLTSPGLLAVTEATP